MVAMPGESYLLKAPAPPCQGQPCRRGTVRSTSCGVVVALLLLLAGVLGLAAAAYCLRLEQCALRAELQAAHAQIDFLAARVADADRKLDRIGLVQQMRVFENDDEPEPSSPDEEDTDDTQPVYDDFEGDFPMENRAQERAPESPAGAVPKLQPAGSLLATEPPGPPGPPAEPRPEDAASARTAGEDSDEDDYYSDSLTGFVTGRGGVGRRDRREAVPQLRLYHTLQAPPAEPWAHHDAGRPQPMYAEQAPVDFVTPPRRSTSTATTPVASRRATDGELGQAHHRRHHSRHGTARRQQRTQQQRHDEPQGLQGLQDLQDVDAATARSAEVKRHHDDYRWRDPRRHPPAPSWRATRSIDSTVEVAQSWRPYAPVVVGPAVAAHFAADTTGPGHRSPPHHWEGRGRHKHKEGEYAGWRASAWVQDLGLDHHFTSAENHVTVSTPGLYLAYAQVNYANDREENGFWLLRNDRVQELLCVVTTTWTAERNASANTCFTAGVLHLGRGDRLSVKDLSGDRFRVLDHPGRSFIGLVNLSTCKPKSEPPAASSTAA